jgi:uncharacterized protein (UPF0548 family)
MIFAHCGGRFPPPRCRCAGVPGCPIQAPLGWDSDTDCDTGAVFRLSKPTQEFADRQLSGARTLPIACPRVLSLEGLPADARLPLGFSHDRSTSVIGRGQSAFDAARRALQQWAHFDLGWVRVTNPLTPIERGQLIAMEAHTAGLWSISISRIVETVDTPTRFGFLYATTRMHVEEGEERFVIELDPASGQVWYLIEAISRPRHLLARLGWPFARAMQHRFVRDSHVHMRSVVGRGE